MITALCIIAFALAQFVVGAAIILFSYWQDFKEWWNTFKDEMEVHP